MTEVRGLVTKVDSLGARGGALGMEEAAEVGPSRGGGAMRL